MLFRDRDRDRAPLFAAQTALDFEALSARLNTRWRLTADARGYVATTDDGLRIAFADSAPLDPREHAWCFIPAGPGAAPGVCRLVRHVNALEGDYHVFAERPALEYSSRAGAREGIAIYHKAHVVVLPPAQFPCDADWYPWFHNWLAYIRPSLFKAEEVP